MPTTSRLTRPPRRPTQDAEVSLGVRTAAAWGWRLVVIAAGVYVVGRVLAYFSSLLVPLLVAVLLAALLAPAVDALVRLRAPRIVASLAVLLAAVAVLAGLVTLVTSQVRAGAFSLIGQVNSGIGQIETWLSEGPLGLSDSQLTDYVGQVQQQFSANASTIASSVIGVTSAATSLLTGAFLVLFLLIFFLHDGARIWGWCVRLLPRAAEVPFDRAVHRGWLTLVAYVRATVVVAFVDALGIGLGAVLIGVPLAVPLGVIVFLGSFVPIVGALVSGAVAVLVALVTVGPAKALVLLLVVLAVQQLESNVLQPFLLGRAVSVHPVAVILSITAGIILAGIPGALFAVPFVAVLNTVVTDLARGDDGGSGDAGPPDEPGGTTAVDAAAPAGTAAAAAPAAPLRPAAAPVAPAPALPPA